MSAETTFAEAAGLACRIDLGKRTHVNKKRLVWTEETTQPLRTLFVAYWDRIRSSGTATLLFSDKDDEYATTTLLEQDALPVWSRPEDVTEWLDDWPDDYQPTRVPIGELLQLLVQTEDADEMIAVGVGDILITFHPAALRELIEPNLGFHTTP